ncbi:Nucleotidyltransferase family protein [Striga hermonthica]|uniref:Nucleotidyltransferase family protein n=1 Tax=Striga hermonthica TaxID=68872 RepID=A0A9N7MMJ9_STRHE|nr:Nucleotidyltransferase family protein [Striga hermonthica]
MNGHNLLEVTFRDILHVIKPSKGDWSVRFLIINEIRDIVGSVESLRGATIEPFGSFVSDLFTKWGDLDISIELQNGSYIASPGKKHKQSLLGDVLKALRKKGGIRRLQFIPNARVPILKFETRYNISCDLSINNLSGQMKSKMLFWINEIDGRFRDLVLLVKEWAKAHHINDSKSGSLNSYSISLLVIFHFQTLVPAILPPLREIYPGNMSDDLTGVRTLAEKRIEDICGANIHRIRSDRSRFINRCSLSDLFISFLAKFSDICTRASTQGINIHAGQLEEINSNMRWLPKTYALFVEDPFEQPTNTARTVGSNQLVKISAVIQATRGALVSANKNQMSLVSVLVGPHALSQLVPRTPGPADTQIPQSAPRIRHTSSQRTAGSTATQIPQSAPRTPQGKNGRGPVEKQAHHKTQNKRADKSPSGAPNAPPMNASTSQKQQAHHKTQNKRADKSPSGAPNAPPMNASTSQKQQVWRPRSKAKVDQGCSDD